MISIRNLLPIFRVRRDMGLARAFRATLTGESGVPDPHQATVLAHLRAFCFADVSTIAFTPDGAADPVASAAQQGRRDVWLMIAFYLNLEERELVQLDREYQQQLRELEQRSTFDA